MKQIFQSLKDGKTAIQDIPSPSLTSGNVLVKSSKTLVSAGTERMLVDFGKANLLEKARKQPDKVKLVLEKIVSNGLKPTLEAVFAKLDEPLPLGYCNVGEVLQVGSGKTNLKKGDRIVSNGKHAEVVRVPFNLCAKVPKNVSDDEAAFAVLGAISLQGIRLVAPTLGEAVVVTGLGLVGLLTVQLLKANGCRVLGIDFDENKCKLAESFGAEVVNLSKNEDPIRAAEIFSRGRGIDAVIITASTNSSQPVHEAANMCRKRGRIVLVGVAGLELSRADFYEKELTFQVSCSYGPGRYDPNYEEDGNDYPFGFVRWTEQRNLEAVLDMISSGSINLKPLISHRFNIQDADDAYNLIINSNKSLGILLEYPVINENIALQTIDLDETHSTTDEEISKVNISFIGAGGYAASTLIPAFNKTNASLISIASSTGISGTSLGRKFGFKKSTTATNEIFTENESNTVVISTRHNTHAKFVIEALKNRKNIFVEKPLCITIEEYEQIKNCYNSLDDKNKPIIMVGFNRRFSPQVKKIKSMLDKVKDKKSFVMTINAGQIPPDHWTQDEKVGGGRIIGEACHFIDLLRFLSGSKIESWVNVSLEEGSNDTVSISLKFADGSIGTIHYFSNGSHKVSKEKLEIFTANKILHLDNFRKLKGYGWNNFKKYNLWHQDKGQNNCVNEFVNAVEVNKKSPIAFSEILEVSKIAIDISNSIR